MDRLLMKKKERIKREKTTLSWLNIFFVIMVTIILVMSVYSLISVMNQKTENENFKEQLDSMKKQIAGSAIQESDLYIEYYRELSDKTDDAVDRMLTILGISIAIITIFSLILAFRAPKDIDSRMDELNGELIEAKEAAEEAKYQAKIAKALTEDSRNERIYELSEIIKDYENKYDAYVLRGNEKQSKTDYEGAIKDYETALKNGLIRETYYNNIGGIFAHKKDFARAIEYHTKAIEENPNKIIFYCNRGRVYNYFGEYKKAISDYNEALMLDPEYVPAYLGRYNACKSLGEKEKNSQMAKGYEKLAKESLDMAIALDPIDKGVKKAKAQRDKREKK